MAERKSALNRAPERPDLAKKLDRARTVKLSDEELEAQRASFIYGNAPQNSGITKESAVRATRNIRVTESV